MCQEQSDAQQPKGRQEQTADRPERTDSRSRAKIPNRVVYEESEYQYSYVSTPSVRRAARGGYALMPNTIVLAPPRATRQFDYVFRFQSKWQMLQGGQLSPRA